MNKQKAYTTEDFLSMHPKDLIAVLQDLYIFDIPETIETIEEMQSVGGMLSISNNQYSYLCVLSSYAKVKVRELKRANIKNSYEDAIDRRDIIESITSAVKERARTLSRLITIKQEVNEELKMTEGRVF